MKGEQILRERLARNWEQIETAVRLRVSQPYLSLIEAGKRPVTESIARRAIGLFGLPPTALPVKDETELNDISSEDKLASDLANLGYPKFAHLKKRSKKVNPAVVLMSALRTDDLESRIVEALPWLIYQFPDMDWVIVVRSAKITDSQNRLGFLLSLAEIKAKKSNEKEKQDLFRELLSNLERSRLYGEDSFRRENLTASERAWLKKYRSKNAKYWRIWSNLTPDHLTF